MRLYEYQAKEILREHALRIPRSMLIYDVREIDRLLQEWMRVPNFAVKAQILEGKRGKQGLILFPDRTELKGVVKNMLKTRVHGKFIPCVLVEKKETIREEHYLALTIDRETRSYMLLYSPSGGMDVEAAGSKVKKICFYEFDERKVKQELRDASLVELARVLFAILKRKDALLVEINPLALTVHGFIPVDCKIIIDDNALFRQKEIAELKNETGTALEVRAAKKGIQYVEVDPNGTVGVIGNGAGLVMATLDTLQYYGVKPVNFLDVGGGTDADVMEESMRLVMAGDPEVLLIVIFGGITHCDEIAKGFLEFRKKKGLKIPVVVKLTGNREKEGRALLEEAGIICLDNLDAAAKSVAEIIAKGRRGI